MFWKQAFDEVKEGLSVESYEHNKKLLRLLLLNSIGSPTSLPKKEIQAVEEKIIFIK